MKRTFNFLMVIVFASGINAQNCPPGTLNSIQNCLNAGAIDFNPAVWTLTGNTGTNPANQYLGTADAKDFVLGTNNQERVRVTSNGNLGIGISAPTELLDINGKLRVRNLSGGLSNVLVTASSPDGVLNSLPFTGNSQDVLLGNGTFGAPPGDNWGSQYVVTNGTLSGDGTPGNALSAHISNDGGNQVVTGGDGGLFVPSPAQDAAWYKSGTSAPPTSITEDKYTMGKVGIGTMTPATTFDVNGVTTLRGNVDIFGDVLFRNQGNTANGSIRFNNSGGGIIMGGGNYPIRFDGSIKINKIADAFLNYNNETVMDFYGGVVDVAFNPILFYKSIRLSSQLPSLFTRGNCEFTFGTYPLASPSSYNFWISNGAQQKVFTITGDGNVGIGTTSPSEKLHVTGNVLAVDYFDISDKRFKKDIQPLEGVMQKIQKLEGFHYQFRREEFQERGFAEGSQIGLIAQNVEEVYPELVKTYEDGYKAVNYDGLIPVLIEGLKAQQQTIESLETKKGVLVEEVALLQNRLDNLESKMNQLLTVHETQLERINYQEVHLNNRQQIILNQNDPNPFSERTSITYFLPEGTEDAELFIHDINGRILNRVMLIPGDGILEVFASNLSSGLYIYSIVVDGQMVETKKMVVGK